MPSALMGGLELLEQRGLIDEDARTIARRGLEQLEILRKSLLRKLERLLEKAYNDGNHQLLITGQSLADELADMEELKQRVIKRLNKSTYDDKEPNSFKNKH